MTTYKIVVICTDGKRHEFVGDERTAEEVKSAVTNRVGICLANDHAVIAFAPGNITRAGIYPIKEGK